VGTGKFSIMAISLSTLTIMIFFKIILCTYDIKKGGDYKRRDTPGRTIQHDLRHTGDYSQNKSDLVLRPDLHQSSQLDQTPLIHLDGSQPGP
jgi:hypothetical protein